MWALSACGGTRLTSTITPIAADTTTKISTSQTTKVEDQPVATIPIYEMTHFFETLTANPSETPFIGPCPTPVPEDYSLFNSGSITIEDSGKTFIAHMTQRFWIYLDDQIYPLKDLFKATPDLIGYVSNLSVRGPWCYPVGFEATREGTGTIRLKGFELTIIVDNSLPESTFPLH
jgi:hypothetical protein